jgi:phage terminase large subunit-like protein
VSLDLEQSAKSLARLDEYARYNRLGGYDPYPFQKRYHASRHEATGELCRQVGLMCVNQIGKTECGLADVAIHATGLYPSGWWDHINAPRLSDMLRKYPDMWCSGPSNDKVRDLAQSKLCGKWADPEALGTGLIPKDRIVDTKRKPGVVDAMETVIVRHRDEVKGDEFNVAITFKAAEAGKKDYMGEGVSYINEDEEHPQDVHSQCLARTTATKGFVKTTFTPEHGLTELVNELLNNRKPWQLFINATHADARHEDGRSHLDPAAVEQLINSYPVHERAMRRTGMPIFGKGLVLPVTDEEIMCDPFPLPGHLFHIGGLDLGSGGNNHPTAACRIAMDRDSRIAYLYWVYRSWATETAVHKQAINSINPWVPFAWPHDGKRKDGYNGPEIVSLYRRGRNNPGGIQVLHNHFQNPKGGNDVEQGIAAMIGAMQEGRFKAFSTLGAFFEEKRQYHRDEHDGTIVPRNDDILSAVRIAFMSQQHAIREPDPDRYDDRPRMTDGVLNYNPLAGM